MELLVSILIAVNIGAIFYKGISKPFKQYLDEYMLSRKIETKSANLSRKEKQVERFHKLSNKLLDTDALSLSKSRGIQLKLDRAGLRLGVAQYRAIKILVAAFMCVLGAGTTVVFIGGAAAVFATALFFLVVGYFAPDLVLYTKEKSRVKQIEKRLPDVLDKLSIIVMSGIGLPEAIHEISKDSRLYPLNEEFRRVDNEVNKLNYSMEKSLMMLSQRCNTQGVSFFIASVIMSINDGSPIRHILQQSAQAARTRWFDALKVRINKLDTKITIPLGVCLMPATMLIIITPILFQALTSFAGFF